ncbi:hypothetical protein ONS95_004705 [Cadophora gregata]|uniref:uncharacterized protein n=1 Tax=Cadophora gregata TaxID=51156 RepID=UPI0026DC4EE5|nr:uncharacterized protein ONS95_004705 [Cadophora gregata]KAK0104412.1 hypothetical protein ONS95_004705 [Cadophora gregata]KAK0115492.1 hypothetical protein ONS96_013947 [Cadophora gregata f. sp. sojae]
MSPPLAKKQKLSQSSPIIFTTLKNEPDTRIFVFNQEFHVSAEPLRMNSAFFEKAFDPCNGKELVSSSPQFKSDWYTTLDKDVGWVLTSSSNYNKDEGHTGFRGKRSQEQEAFNNILCAIFNREYKITSAAELNSMVIQAEYYGALPVVSNSLTGPFYTSPGLLSSDTDATILLQTAFKLRHKALFRECFIHVLGPWSDPQYKNLSDQTLFKMADATYKRTELQIMRLHLDLFQVAANCPPDSKYMVSDGTEHIQHLVGLAPKCLGEDGKIIMPKFFRMCFTAAARKHPEAHGEIEKMLGRILQNRLVLMKDAVSGEGEFEDHFLHFSVPDRMLPWDLREVTW